MFAYSFLLTGSVLAGLYAVMRAFCLARFALQKQYAPYRCDLLLRAAWQLVALGAIVAGWTSVWPHLHELADYVRKWPDGVHYWPHSVIDEPLSGALLLLGLSAAVCGVVAAEPVLHDRIRIRIAPRRVTPGFAVVAGAAICAAGGGIYWLVASAVRAIEFYNRPEHTDEIFRGLEWSSQVQAGSWFLLISLAGLPLIVGVCRTIRDESRTRHCVLLTVLLGGLCITSRYAVLPRFCPAMVDTDFGVLHLVTKAPLQLALLVTLITWRLQPATRQATVRRGRVPGRWIRHVGTLAMVTITLGASATLADSMVDGARPMLSQILSGEVALEAARLLLNPIRLLLAGLCLLIVNKLVHQFTNGSQAEISGLIRISLSRFLRTWVITATALIASMDTMAWWSIGAWWVACRA